MGGPKYIKALKGPFPQIEMIPTGGVNLETAGEFLKAGACAVAVGGEFFGEQRAELAGGEIGQPPHAVEGRVAGPGGDDDA